MKLVQILTESQPSDPNLLAIREAALEFFKEWDEASLTGLREASDFDSIVKEISEFADSVGVNKGYDPDEIAEVENDFQVAIATKAGLPDYFLEP